MTSKWLTWSPGGVPAKPTPPPRFQLSGHAVEFERNGERHFLVADEADAQLLSELERASRGEIWTAAEIDLLARVSDQTARDEIARWKRLFHARLSAEARGRSITHLPRPPQIGLHGDVRRARRTERCRR